MNPAAWPAAVALVSAFALVVWLGIPAAPTPVPAERAAEGPPEPVPLRVATRDLRYGLGPRGRFEPLRVLAEVERADPHVMALHQVPGGLALAYGVDLALWLERRGQVPVFFAPGPHRMAGHGIIAGVPTLEVSLEPLPDDGAARSRVLRLHAMVGGRSIFFHVLPAPRPGVGERYAGAVAEAMGSVRFVAMGPARADTVPGMDRAMGRVGGSRALPPPSGVWVRGLAVEGGGLLDLEELSGPLVGVTLQIPSGDIR